MNKKIARVFTVAAMAVMAFALCFGLAACGGSKSSDEKLIKDSINSELAGIKAMDAQSLATLTQSAGDISSQLGISSEQFIKAWFDGFDYKINSVTVDGKKADASIDLTIKDFKVAIKTFSDDLDALLEDDAFISDLMGMSEDKMTEALTKKSGEILLAAFAKAPMKTASVELPYTLKDNTWTPDDDIETILADAILGDLSNL